MTAVEEVEVVTLRMKVEVVACEVVAIVEDTGSSKGETPTGATGNLERCELRVWVWPWVRIE